MDRRETMTISPDDKQRLFKIMDEVNWDNAPPDLLSDIKQQFPKATWEEMGTAMKEHAELQLERSRELERESAFMDMMIEVTRRDPDHHDDEPVLEVLGRLAERGDSDAKQILASFENPLQKAVRYLLDQAIAEAPDWENDGIYIQPVEDARDYSRVIVEFLADAEYDVMSLLPDEMKSGINPVDLTTELSKVIRSDREEEMYMRRNAR
jgi:hypothetical protein